VELDQQQCGPKGRRLLLELNIIKIQPVEDSRIKRIGNPLRVYGLPDRPKPDSYPPRPPTGKPTQEADPGVLAPEQGGLEQGGLQKAMG
jgi:hypothetical protein